MPLTGAIGLWLQSSPSGFTLWAIFLFLALVCLLIGVSVNKKPNGKPNQAVALARQKGSFMPSDTLPAQWDETAIARQLDAFRGQSPALVSHYIESVKTRWVTNQNDKTAAVRGRFLKTKLEELKLFKEGQQLMVDLEALVLEREKRLKTLQLENAQLDATMRTRSDREQMVALKERKQLELDIAKLDKEIRELNAPAPSPEQQISPEQKRAKDREACEARLADLKTQKQKALLIQDEDERLLRVNAIDAALEREYERWAKLL